MNVNQILILSEEIMKYLLTYNRNLGAEEDVKSLLNTIPSISDWRTDIPNTFLIETDADIKEVAEQLIKERPNSRFFISEISGNRAGWLPKDAWNFIKN